MGDRGDGDEPAQDSVPPLIPVRMLNEFVYCPRLAWLEWVQGEFEDNADTVEGRFRHRRVDRASGSLRQVNSADSDHKSSDGREEEDATTPPALSTPPPQTVHARSVMLSSASLGIIAKMDLVESDGQRATPVDYKRGSPPDVPERAWEPERVQVCAQGLILREHGFVCDSGVIYFTGSRTRVDVPFDDALVARTHEAIAGLRELAGSGSIPPPLVDSPKCPRCSLVGICLPDEVNVLAGRQPDAKPKARRMAPAREQGLPLHVLEQGARVGKDGDTLEVTVNRERLARARLIDLGHLSVHGNVQVSTQALRTLAERGIPICWFTYGGWFTAVTHGMHHKNVELRRRQFALAEDADARLRLARAFVEGKIRNSRTLLRRNHSASPVAALREMARLSKQVRSCASEESLLGIEGAAARTYFSQLPGMLKDVPGGAFDFRSRNRRPPRDPVNALLSFGYALLTRDCTVAVLAAGFDPYLGFYHKPRYGRPSLALDLAEEFRPLIVDSTVLSTINSGEVRPSDFTLAAGAAALTPRGRRQFIAAYERRMGTEVTHPVFGYAISYRKVLAVQARLLARFVGAELDRYPAFCTR